MDWQRDLPAWPNHAYSRRLRCAPHDWHVQELGTGETLLLIHGAGASVHSWRDLLPALARDRHVVAIDLPGQGFTRAGRRDRFGLEPMAADIARLAEAQGWRPAALIGHSAGGAIALALSEHLRAPSGRPPVVVGINAALGRFEGIAGWLFPLLAKALAANPLAPRLLTLGGPKDALARRLIEGTGSRIDAAGLACYARLIGDPQHVGATLRMMAQWNIDPLLDRLPELQARCVLIAGARDTAVPPEVAREAIARMRNATLRLLPDLGHLAHEEAPDRMLDAITEAIEARG
ncbi:alpha/beta fold hydrolase BchO [Limimaricola pyoseonensis]|uniref:Magnesium chelatase accessory protein n=1 Tax=Limimaricola pyoseonensis TaxID=521013 RepID=A0A1G7B1Z5_9RHOB|nr:alpha/beta fold hydrolase BchO [Limimaricola pyoseonensis]SDE21043.1 magnesium chelatase accessory protein [Limimaricola pyoseonensis]